jgi:hypothetical protein
VANAVEAFNIYSLPPYALLSLSLAMPDRQIFGNRPTSFSLRVSDLLDSRPPSPGVGGVDYPGLGRTFTLTIMQGI